MPETIQIPKVGAVQKKTVLLVGAAGAGVVVYLLYRQRANAAADDAAAVDVPADPGLSDMGADLTSTGTGGAVTGYSGNGDDTATTGFTTNAQWSQAASESLAGSFDQGAVTEALGRYLSRQPLSDLDQRIVQSAIAFAGYPPVGTYTMIPGGNTSITVAPSTLTGNALTGSSVQLSWNPVSGATGYHIWESGVTQTVGDSFTSSGQVGGLHPGTSYTFSVSAFGANSKDGPKSNTVTIKTPSATVAAPAGVSVNNIQRTSLSVFWRAVPGASSYDVYGNGVKRATVGGVQSTQGGLKPGTKYTFYVVAHSTGGGTSPHSASVSVTTKK